MMLMIYLTVIRMWRYVVIIGSLVVFSCKKNKECGFDGPYEFQLPVSFTPAVDTLHIGDTIFIESRFSNMVFERKTQKSYKLEAFSFYPQSDVRKVDRNPAEPGLEYFEFIIDTSYNYEVFQYGDGTSDIIGQYKYEKNKYELEYQLVCRVSGLYYFNHNTFLVNGPGEEQDFPGKCKGKLVHSYSTTNNAENNNMDLLRNSPDLLYNQKIFEKPQERFHDNGGYVFYVVE